MRKRLFGAALLLCALLLTGCGETDGKDTPAAAATDAPSVTAAPEGPAAQAVRKLLASFQAELSRVSVQSGGTAAFTVPVELLEQMSRDAQAADAQAAEGRWRFTVREEGRHVYEAAALDLYQSDYSVLTATPDPGDDAPQDRQLMGDYDVAGGGEFVRVRSYDMAEDLSSGQAELTDFLNGETTGHESFSFALRDGRLYFVDAAMELTANLDQLEDQGKRLVAAGYLAENGLDVVEYEAPDGVPLPDPAALDMAALLSSVTPLTRVSDQNGQITLTP